MAKASRVRGLSPSRSLSHNARRILLGRLADVLEWIPRARKGECPEALHDLRIAVKRLRYGLEFLGPAVGSARMKPYLKRMRALQEVLGEATDADIFARRLGALDAAMPSDTAREGLRGLVARLDAERDGRGSAALDELDRLCEEAFWPNLIRDLG